MRNEQISSGSDQAGLNELGLMAIKMRTVFETTRRLSASLDADVVLQTLSLAVMGQMMVSRLAVITAQGGSKPVLVFARGSRPEASGELERAAEALLRQWDTREGPRLVAELAADAQLSSAAEVLARHDIGVVVPMQASDATLGLLLLGKRWTGQAYGAGELQLLAILADQAMIALENARLVKETVRIQRLERELALARDIQQGLIGKIPQDGAVAVAGLLEMCREVGGDYYDFVRREGELAFIVADVAGKGMPAALLMASLRASYHALQEEATSPARLAARLSALLWESAGSGRYVTAFLGLLRPSRGELVYCNAGHNPPFLIRPDDGETAVGRLEAGGMPLGILPDLSYSEELVRISPGSVLALFTDGFSEATNAEDDEFGEERIGSLAAEVRTSPAPMILAHVVRAVSAHAGGARQQDDRTLVVLQLAQ